MGICYKTANFLVLHHEHFFDTGYLNVYVITDKPRHLWIEIASQKPVGDLFWHYKRGTAVLHDKNYTWHPWLSVGQEEAGLTIEHTFKIAALEQCTDVYWMFRGMDAEFWACSSTPWWEAHVLFAPPAPGPQPTLTPIDLGVEPSIMRPGQRLTFWANNTWYVILGFADSIRVYKLRDGFFWRQDVLNEPSPATGSFADVDCRLDSAGVQIHMAMYIWDYDGVTDYVTYARYNTSTDTWGVMEAVCPTANTGMLDYDVAISLDPADKPHVVYPDTYTYGLAIYYRNKIGVSWSARETAILRNFRNYMHVSASHDLTNDAFHLIADDNYGWVNYNRRTSGGAWDGRTWLTTQGVNLPYHSIMCDQQHPHVAFCMTTFRCCRATGTPPIDFDTNLTLATSQRFSIVVPPSLTPDVYIIYRRNNGRPARIYKPWGYGWSPEGDLYDEAIVSISANLADSTVISTVARRSVGHNALFYAFSVY